MTFDKRIISALRECKTEQQIEDCFIRFGITDIQEKQRHLIYAMYAPSYFFTTKEPLTENDLYNALLYDFISGRWRLTPLYEQLGLVKKPLEDADNRLLEKLTVCTSQQEIDAVFEREGIAALHDRCNVLRRCMRIQEIVGTIGVFSEQADYNFDCSVFLEGSWRNM